ncbi:hypothetical protein P691DRAFT_808201 [Macrolepiota fuliginosa MF-IS2]|uniref:Uncharacterized protein n=1 Tax=Macrolepiota fuliginosa MF-IS2 TaxID=1400762 RepID=A0A9P6BZQ7_9AGAR|nr:hypothetical protein P691DRAFT_808201 [Macrolepiota fuliginosa MF-IS2]
MSYYSPTYAASSSNGIPSYNPSAYNHLSSGNYVTPYHKAQLAYYPSSTPHTPAPFAAQHPIPHGYFMPPPSPVIPSSCPCQYHHGHTHTQHGYPSLPYYNHHSAAPPGVFPTPGAFSYQNTPPVVSAMAGMPSANYGAPVYTSAVGDHGYYQSGIPQAPVQVLSSSSGSDRHHSRSRHHHHHHHSRHSGHSHGSRSRSSSPDIPSSHGHRSSRNRGLLTYLPSL